jgi:uncharacterized protein YbjQ (UPF0145 family)
MAIEHRNLTGAQLHEPKGCATAGAGTVYVADGVGSGAWSNLLAADRAANRIVLSHHFTDISNAQSVFMLTPISGVVRSIHVVLHGAITTANSIVDARINGVSVVGSSITVTHTGSAAGQAFSSFPTGANALTANGVVEVRTDGGSSTVAMASVFVVVDTAL